MRFRASTRYLHLAQWAAIDNIDLTAADDIIVNPAREDERTVFGQYDPRHVSFPLDGIEPAIYFAEDTTARQINDNDPEET